MASDPSLMKAPSRIALNLYYPEAQPPQSHLPPRPSLKKSTERCSASLIDPVANLHEHRKVLSLTIFTHRILLHAAKESMISSIPYRLWHITDIAFTQSRVLQTILKLLLSETSLHLRGSWTTRKWDSFGRSKQLPIRNG